ncbi:MAG: hypothetical protein AB7I79_01785 [Rhizobiaceae bacterium]
MTAIALSDFLQDFGRRAGSTEPVVMERRPHVVLAGPSPEEIETRIAAEVEKATEAAVEKLTRIYEDTLDVERRQHADEAARLRDAVGGEIGTLVSARLVEMEDNLVRMTTATAARVLAAFLGDALRKQALDRLADSIRDAARDRDAVRIVVRGPQSLHERLVAALGDRTESLEFVETAGIDLVVSIDGALFETRIAEWSAALAEVVS